MITKQLHYHRFPETVATPVEAVALDNIQRLLSPRIEPTRSDVAAIVRLCCLVAYVGGRHVAIHSADPTGEIVGAPISMFTGNYGEWL